MSEIEFDIVIPVHRKDLQILEYVIDFARKNIVGARRIITVSKRRHSDNAEWFCEDDFPFSFADVKKYLGVRSGWHFQQLLKMYAPIAIPDIAKDVMILDADTVFFKKTRMFDSQNRPFYNLSKDKEISTKPFDLKVEEHIRKLLPSISRQNIPKKYQKYSGIAHNMMFNGDFMGELFAKIEEFDGSGDKFYQIFLKNTDASHGVSEYQLYFNFLTVFHADKIAIRKLRYKNTADIDIKKYRRDFRYSYCSFHSYLRGNKRDSLKIRVFAALKKLYRKIFLISQWNIGVIKCNISEILDMPNRDICWLEAPKIDEFRADPFGMVKNGEKCVFFEKYDYNRRKGEIASLVLDENCRILREKEALVAKNHLSYPYIIGDKVVLESHRARELAVYDILDDLTLAKNRVIFEDLDVVDPAIIEHEGRFWLFYGLASAGDDKLFLAFADKIDGKWQNHPQNPVKEGIRGTRMAGEIFKHEGEIYRPGQDCLSDYGAGILINRVKKLTVDEFLEEEFVEMHPNQLGKYPKGMHNIAKLGEDWTVVDGRREVFVAWKALIYLKRLVLRFFA